MCPAFFQRRHSASACIQHQAAAIGGRSVERHSVFMARLLIGCVAWLQVLLYNLQGPHQTRPPNEPASQPQTSHQGCSTSSAQPSPPQPPSPPPTADPSKQAQQERGTPPHSSTHHYSPPRSSPAVPSLLLGDLHAMANKTTANNDSQNNLPTPPQTLLSQRSTPAYAPQSPAQRDRVLWPSVSQRQADSHRVSDPGCTSFIGQQQQHLPTQRTREWASHSLGMGRAGSAASAHRPAFESHQSPQVRQAPA